jgi:hypothetical protein
VHTCIRFNDFLQQTSWPTTFIHGEIVDANRIDRTHDAIAAARKKSMNPAYRPMLATLVDEPFDNKAWVFETKWDGFRLITEKRGDTVRLWSRNGIDATTRYAVLVPALQKIQGSCVIDGELCALDEHGRSRFQLLQNALNKKARLLYVIFDVLFVDGKDIREKPLLERKETLKGILPRDPRRGAMDVDARVRLPRRPLTNARLRGGSRGGDESVREVLARRMSGAPGWIRTSICRFRGSVPLHSSHWSVETRAGIEPACALLQSAP